MFSLSTLLSYALKLFASLSVSEDKIVDYERKLMQLVPLRSAYLCFCLIRQILLNCLQWILTLTFD
jgi:hypothetical protein